MITILREPDVDGVRRPDKVDEALLIKTEGVVDNENEHTIWVEYRFPDSDVVVHRSCHVTMKRWPDSLGATAQPLV